MTYILGGQRGQGSRWEGGDIDRGTLIGEKGKAEVEKVTTIPLQFFSTMVDASLT